MPSENTYDLYDWRNGEWIKLGEAPNLRAAVRRCMERGWFYHERGTPMPEKPGQA